MATRERKKALARREMRKREVGTASLRNLKTSARKARVLANLIRGFSLNEAYDILGHQIRFAAHPIRNLLKSAASNANNRGFDSDFLYVDEIQIHKGPIGKRFLHRAQGKATPIRKQSAHIDICLSKRDKK